MGDLIWFNQEQWWYDGDLMRIIWLNYNDNTSHGIDMNVIWCGLMPIQTPAFGDGFYYPYGNIRDGAPSGKLT